MLSNIVKGLAILGPFAAKNLPKLWPLLLESKNREKVTQAMQDLASQSPRKRLKARVDLTAELADRIASQAGDEQSKARAGAWVSRARDLGHLLDVPVQGRKERKAHRALVRSQLNELQGEMNDYLTHSSLPSEPTSIK